jgi:hypothetical protein
MRKCRFGKMLGKYYHNYGDMFEKMSLLDIVAWTVGSAALSVAVGWAFGKIVECTCEKLLIGDDSKDPVTETEKDPDDDE